MGSQVPAVKRVGIGRLDNGGGSELRNGDVIWMSVASIGTKGNDNVGLDEPQVSYDLCYDLGRVGLVQLAIDVPQEIDAADTEDFGCRSQFRFAYLAQCL